MAVEIELVAEHCSSVWWFTDNASQWWTRQIKTFCDPGKQISPANDPSKIVLSPDLPPRTQIWERESEKGGLCHRLYGAV